MRLRWLGLSLMIAAMLAGAFASDGPVATFVHTHRWDQKQPGVASVIREMIKLPGFFPTTLLLAVGVAAITVDRLKNAVFLLLTTLPAALNEPIKILAGRLRPFKAWGSRAEPFDFHPFSIGPRQWFHTPNLSFPSGHAALAFATATALSILFPRGRVAFWIVAILVGAERVTENAHWCSDVVAAAILGVGGALLVKRIFFSPDRRWAFFKSHELAS